ncbi:SAM-dependent methyltransferase [Gracilibacillus boraciitolerans JCM 21714]|uniref:SAM-dependent methyltransferase n=1 Tax=Gracilibacillus boraciitolerans JCM 21714 TaxID=1298598 RepID=W4VE66_9BACI|nr:class I SAM-dependent methyltransferase [Gracilibacillus boraciitolerans]GAE91108.1 SAM-dependent methyltransferase [Gracilibacillus boraciitolerans JCM 21714]
MSKWMANAYDTIMQPFEKNRFKKVRENLIRQATGDILEIGAGTGINFQYYKKDCIITAIEPDQAMRQLAFKRIGDRQITIHNEKAQSLPFEDQSFDTVVATLVFCTISDPEQALTEILRVLKPGGKALFFEHVRVGHPVIGPIQDILTPVWKRIAGGCHLNRDTEQLITDAGLLVTRSYAFYQTIFQVIETKKDN